MKTFTTINALALAGNVAAFWRMPCRSTTGVARIDPLVSPLNVADHSHIVFGGGNFGNNASYESLAQCADPEYDCTSCGVTQDKSAYWTPPLYFQHSNGSVEMVENVGGMLAYYLLYMDDLKPFPEGFQMIAGNPAYRNFTGPFPDTPLSDWPTDPTDQFFLQQRAIGFNCLNYAKDPEASLYRHVFPTKDELDNTCLDGLRLEMAFPSCGTGAIDSADHRSHVAYPSLVKEGNCPEGYDVHYPFLFFETIYATQNFAGVPGQFVLSTGDPVGPSYHGDFIMGWDSADFLGQAIDTCTNASGEVEDCPLFTLQSDSDAAKCTFPMPSDLEDDDCSGPREGLPVGVPIQYGPEPATKYPVPGYVSSGSTAATSAIPKTSAPATYSPSAPSYSPANPSVTATAQGGIIVAYDSSSSSSSITSAPASTATDSPDVTTSYITKGTEVWEMVIEEVEVTVTATATVSASTTTASTTPAGYAAPASYKHKRHVEKHAHHHKH